MKPYLAPCASLLLLAFATACTTPADPESPDEPSLNSGSHWLQSCHDASGCDANHACLCGVCTVACDADQPCAGESAAAVCIDAETALSEGTCVSLDAPGFCATPCTEDAECPAGLCLAGICRDGAGLAPALVLVGDDGARVARIGDSFSPTQTTSADDPLRAVASGEGLYVAVGGASEGVAFVSPDGVHWTRTATGTEPLYGVTFGDGVFVAVGDNNTITTSTDGRAWESFERPPANNLVGVAFGGGTFVAVGDKGVRLVSSDADAWQVGASDDETEFAAVAHGGGRFLAVGQGGRTSVSEDGESWMDDFTMGGGNLLSVAYGEANPGGEVFVVAGGDRVVRIFGGEEWDEDATPIRAVTFGDGVFYVIATAGNEVQSSEDTITWQSVGAPDGEATLRALTYPSR